MVDSNYIKKEVSDEELLRTQRFWDGTVAVYSNAKLTTESAGDLEIILEKSKNIEYLICLGVATGCRDPLALLEHIKTIPKKIIVNDLSPKLLKICYHDLIADLKKNSSNNTEVLALEGAIHDILNKDLINFKEYGEPLFALGVYKEEIFYNRLPGNPHSALELYSEERENIGDNLCVSPLIYNGTILVNESDKIFFELPFTNRQFVAICKKLQEVKQTNNFCGFKVESEKQGNPFISHYYTEEGIYKLVSAAFNHPEYEIDLVDTQYRNYVLFVKKKGKSTNCLITMINNVLGNIPTNLQQTTLKNIRDAFYNQ